MRIFNLLRYVPKPTLGIAVGASFLAGLANVLVVALISRGLTVETGLTTAFVLQFALVVVAVLVLDYSVKWLLLRLTARTSYELRTQLSQRILQTPLADLEHIGTPRLLAALTNDVHMLVMALNQTPILATSSAILLGCFVYLAWLSPATMVVITLLILPAVLVQVWLRGKSRLSMRQALATRNELFSQYGMLTDGMKELKMNRARRHDYLDKLLLPTAREYEDLSIRARVLYHVANSWVQAIYFLFILILFFMATRWQMTAETLTSFALVALYARTSMNGILSTLPLLNEAAVAAEDLERLGVHLSAVAPEAPVPTPPVPLRVHISVTQLHHTYRVEHEEQPFRLGPIDLELCSGELVFLIGGNGSGKTTLAKLLLGLYMPEEGTISWNDQQVTAENLDEFRQLFSAVFADFFLFEQLLGVDAWDDDARARNYLRQLQLDHKVDVRHGQFSTTDLSTGQRQRLALLSAYMEDRAVYLFDEWAAGQDPAFKEIFYRQILPDLRDRGKLVIVISHDDHYYDTADRLIKLNFGEIEFDRRRQATPA